ncbi:fatty acid desaturase family protein [Nocardioides sp. Soil796]|uniref:fatty acid desaturase family protein n=1 Tax=Nocardioides sp. Soil796 TaxID=1736412 RepID=UPI00070C66F7|nr:acyl-CoA desaturase [Nocardioides sp. Soil796]KRF14161.1 delta fatty acid desaturase [Nocardioides sp. Soil796]
MTIDLQTEPSSRRDHGGSDFAELRRRIDDAGLLDRRPGYYAARFALLGTAVVVGWASFVAIGSTWWQLVTAVALAVVFAQLALLAHDIAHRQVFRTRRPSEIAGRLVGNLGVGMSYGWWMDKHTRHHANPNHEELDPDVSPDLLVWSQDQARNASGAARFIGKYEAFLFFPLLTLEAFNLHISSVRAVLEPGLKERRLEGGLLLAHFAIYLSLVFTVLSPGLAIAFILLNQAVFGLYLGCSFAPNHKGMPTLTGDREPDYLRKQVLTSRNVRGGPVVDVALGGLNYQIEHHLFPSMPCANLRQARPMVRDFCVERGVEYAEAGLVESYTIALRHMHSVGEPLRAA